MATAKKDSKERTFKMVISLKSGKSIVSHGIESVCFNLYNQWIKQGTDGVESNVNDKIVIEKKKDNKIVEVSSVLMTEIAAIQMVVADNE